MNAACPTDRRLVLTAVFLCAELFHLGWEATHGGVRAHHLLANPDLPAVSNWWGALLIPLLSWWLVGGIGRRVARRQASPARRGISPWAGLAGALVYGGALATLFAAGNPLVDALFVGMLALGLVINLCRPEFVLGFVLGMTWVVGAVLPTLFAFVIAGVSWLVHAAAGALWRRVRPQGGAA